VGFERLTAQAAYAVSRSGTLAWATDSQYRALRQLVWIDREGRETLAVPESAIYREARLSPDGGRVALTIEEGSEDIWIIDLGSGARTRLTREPTIETRPVWAPDGRRIYYQAEHGSFDLYARGVEAGDSSVSLAASGFDKYPASVTPDGRSLIAMEDETTERLIEVPLDRPGRFRVLAQGAYNLESPMVSPSGRWVAYASNETADYQIHAARYGPTLTDARELTRGGVTSSLDYPWIRWAGADSEILYRKGDSVMSLAFDGRSGSGEAPRLVFRTDNELADVSRDGRRFLAVKAPSETAPRRFDVMLNWSRRVAVSGGAP
jgi:Tol biopolymer transport system component